MKKGVQLLTESIELLDRDWIFPVFNHGHLAPDVTQLEFKISVLVMTQTIELGDAITEALENNKVYLRLAWLNDMPTVIFQQPCIFKL